MASASGLPPAPAQASPAQPDRLARALEGLRAALAQQAGVVAAWRASLVELEGAVGSLQLGLVRQASTVQDLGAQVSRAATALGTAAPSRPR